MINCRFKIVKTLVHLWYHENYIGYINIFMVHIFAWLRLTTPLYSDWKLDIGNVTNTQKCFKICLIRLVDEKIVTLESYRVKTSAVDDQDVQLPSI